MILGFLSQKGGTGKTTLAVNVAAELARRGRRVLLVDADEQGSALDWLNIRQVDPLFPVVGLPNPTIHRQIGELARNYQDVIIDSPARTEKIAKSIIAASELVAIPVQPSPFDVWGAKGALELVTEAQSFKPTLKTVFVINRKIVNTAIGRDVREALAGYGVPVLATAIHQRIIFAESAATGRAVFEVDPGSLAAGEIAALAEELLRR